jgi:ATP-binding cassette subfamily B protein
MIKIFKNMMPYWKWLIVIILLLVVQVYCDLSLPQYTSDIIDVGIQNQGLTHILPEKITPQDYEMAQLFMTSQEREPFAAYYKMENQTYIRSTNDHEVLDSYDEEFLVPLVMIYQFNTARMSAASGTESDFTMTEEQQALIAMLENGALSDEMILEIRSSVSEQIETLGSSTLKSMGIAFAAYCDENAQVDLDQVQMSYMWSTGGKMLLIALIMMLCSAVVGYCASRVGAGVGRDLRIKTFCNVVEYSNAEMDRFSTASLITRSTNDIQQIQMVTAVFLRMVLMAPIMGVGGIIKVAQTGAGM